MKLKKGSLEAKKFMEKIRAKKGKPKKISGVKKPSVKKTHTDIKSHNYKISISGIEKKLSSSAIKELKKIAKISSLFYKLDKLAFREIQGYNKMREAEENCFQVLYENGYISNIYGKLIKTTKYTE
jgi:transposase-like protein